MRPRANELESEMIGVTTKSQEELSAANQPPRSFLWASTGFAAQVVLTLALIIWFAHFWHSRQFGLYEDDWFFIPDTMGLSWPELWKLVRGDLAMRNQGRPVGMVLIHFFSFVGFKTGGLTAIYNIAFLVLLTNAMLFYCLVKRIFNDRRFAFLAAVAYALFPADTTQAFLVHALWVQPAITLLLIALLLYTSGWRIGSYIAILLSLLAYETPFCVFMVAPALKRERRSDLLKHCAILAVILGCVVLLRAAAAESRVSHIATWQLLLGSTNVITGPLTCLLMYIYRPAQELFHLTRHEPFILLSYCIAFIAILSRQLSRSGAPATRVFRADLAHTDSWRRLQIGVLMLLAAYPLTFSTIGIAVAGRGTRVHLAAVLGASIICAWVISLILDRLKAKGGQWVGTTFLIGYCTLLLKFGLTVQRDYVLGWQEQRGFWTDVMRLCPDLNDGDAIFVEPTGLRDTRQLLFLRRNLYGTPETRQIKSLEFLRAVLPKLYAFPEGWKQAPAVFRLPEKWERELFGSGGTLRLMTIEGDEGRITPRGEVRTVSTAGTVPASKAILLETKNGQLTRRTSLINPQTGTQVRLKVDPSTTTDIPIKPMYRYLILPAAEKRVSYLVK